jgi:hypothetical protein
MVGQLGPRKEGPLVGTKWQAFAWNHEPISDCFNCTVPKEIILGQLVTEFVGPFFQNRLGGQSIFRWHGEKPPRHIPEDFEFQIETTMIPSVQEYLDNLLMIKVVFVDTPLFIQMHKDSTVKQLDMEITSLLNGRGQGGDYQVEEDVSILIDPDVELPYAPATDHTIPGIHPGNEVRSLGR